MGMDLVRIYNTKRIILCIQKTRKNTPEFYSCMIYFIVLYFQDNTELNEVSKSLSSLKNPEALMMGLHGSET